jgi:hypothetical protein
MHSAQEIDAKVQGYLTRGTSLEELRVWFGVSAGVLFDEQDARILELSAALQLAFIEYDKGGFSERQLRSYLKQAVQELGTTENTSVPQ